MKRYLLVDAGNSRLKWCTLHESVLGEINALAYSGNDPAQTLAELLEGDAVGYAHLVIVSVLGEPFLKQSEIIAKQHGLAFSAVSSLEKLGKFQNGYETPSRLGADRFVALYAASVLFEGSPVLVIDCGTAVTIDALLPDARHLGGLILPGLTICRDSLVSGTRLLELNNKNKDESATVLFARKTPQAIRGGALYGLGGAIDSICHSMEQAVLEKQSDSKGKPIRLVCGGDAPVLLPLLRGEYHHQTDLVMQGLRSIVLTDEL